ncbi:T9SS type A sorting domain-containing protein [Candidatus Neomarinimicrobiota bacterium]
MKKSKVYQELLIVFTVLILLPCVAGAQMREYRVHDRGMLHETVYNTGEIGRGYQYGPAGETTELPLMEWPSRSQAVINNVQYSGQHNIVGAGVLLSANQEGLPGLQNRLFSICGGSGTNTPELPFGEWSFPISIEEIENFPLIVDDDGYGVVNPNFVPNEAEEKIVAKWATNIGIQITRTSRSWSYPDYDDMIIYEYEFEFTGDTDGRPETIETDTTLTDVIIQFVHGFAPSMFGYQRTSSTGSWDNDLFSRGDAMNYYDPDYWLAFDMVTRTGAADAGIFNGAGHPEPDADNFLLWSNTGLYGGGLLSPQAPGMCFMYYDTDHLAFIGPDSATEHLNESEVVPYLTEHSDYGFYEIDENNRMKQPWNYKQLTSNTRSSKLTGNGMNLSERWGSEYTPGLFTNYPDFMDNAGYPAPAGEEYIGRAYAGHTGSWNGTSYDIGFGPYTMVLGEKFSIVMAEVIGYGATAGKQLIGGQVDVPFAPAPTFNKKIEIDGVTMTEHYLDDFGYPDYINSDVITVNHVAHKAHEAYLGTTIPYDSEGMGPDAGVLWPENHPGPGHANQYNIPIPVPAPILVIENTPRATVEVSWNRSAEDFTAVELMGTLTSYRVYRSVMGMGPWELLETIAVGDVNADGLYLYEDTDQTFKIGEEKYYAVTSVDENGYESGKSNITVHAKNIGAVDQVGNVYAVPNPYFGRSGFIGVDVERKIEFYGLPPRCTIKIYSFAGQLVRTLEHDADTFSEAWDQVSSNNQDIASGLYIYVVTTPEGDKTTGKIIIVK